jgi:RNA polymerase sigma factor (sigma-70 family)
VRRTLAARVHDRHLIDDLTQETLLRLARSDRQLSPDEQRAYAVVTARNLLATHFRRRSVHERYLHRLLEHEGGADPEQRILQQEETDAMAAAMSRIDPEERKLLVRHEVGGTDLATLAGEADVSSGAIARRLARARANLRLEFLLVFRRQALPTQHCRPVLLALAAGDRRRQTQLDAADHLAHCLVCASLEGPMTQRDRRVAGWLLVPLGTALRRMRRAARAHWARTAAAVVFAAGVGGLIFTIANDRADGRDADRVATAPTAITTVAPASPPSQVVVASPPAASSAAVSAAPPTLAAASSAVPASSTQPAPAPAPEAPIAPSTQTRPETTPACPPPLTLSQVDPGAVVGCPFALSVVTVADVSSGAHIAAVTENRRTVSIDLAGAGAGLPLTVVPGVRLTITGVVTAATEQHLDVEVHASDLRLAS